MDIIKKNGKNAMTLIEILIVITLIGILTGVLVKSLGGNMLAGQKATAKLFCTKTVKGAIESYKVTHDGKLPTDWKGMEKVISLDNEAKTAPKDPWNNDYIFVKSPGGAATTAPSPMEGIHGEGQEPQPVAGYVLIMAKAPDGETVFAYHR
ncbi:MAG: type II secretion system GspH family protein [Puniceicoccales bacterium]|jgi:prepilin-type N-terminal cleavage/methylation domain-containing protein|nr:type II secretion system GspH family protein [Puniceicoccales bacterium]